MKSYHGHESQYRRMLQQNIASWNQHLSPAGPEIEPLDETFFQEVLDRLAPKAGRVLELGCGTGPMLRWFGRRGSSGLGVDVSPTALKLARAQSANLKIRFTRADACAPDFHPGQFNIVLDGHCLHCIVNQDDRRQFLSNAKNCLKKDGILIILTMCGPANLELFPQQYPNQKLYQNVIYVPARDLDFADIRKIKGQRWLPTRRLIPYPAILRELAAAGLKPLLFRFYAPHDEPNGYLMLAATIE